MQHAVSQLISKKAELQGELQYYRDRIEQLENMIQGVNTAISVFDPDFNIKDIKPKRYRLKKHRFKHGETHKLVLDALRKADKPISTYEIAQNLMKSKNFDTTDHILVKNIQKTIAKTIKNQANNNLIRKTHNDSFNNYYWEIVA